MNLENDECIKQIEMLDYKNNLIAEQIKLKYIETIKLNKIYLKQISELSNELDKKTDECICLRKDIDEFNNKILEAVQIINKISSNYS